MLIRIENSQVFLIPSLHRLPWGYAVPQYLLDAARACQLIVFERDISKPLDVRANVDPRLIDAIPSLDREAFERIWTGPAVSGSSTDIQTLTLQTAIATIDGAVSEHTFGLRFESGVDYQLWHLVGAEKRTWIESEDESAVALAIFPEEEQISEFNYVCDIVRRRDDFRAELKAWQTADLGALDKVADEIYERTPARAEAVLGQRNQVMLRAVMESLSREDSVAYVLGAAHIVGANGLLKALQERAIGWVVTPKA